MMIGKDSFKGYVVVFKGTKQLAHFVVYHQESVAHAEASEWLESDQYEIVPIYRRMVQLTGVASLNKMAATEEKA